MIIIGINCFFLNLNEVFQYSKHIYQPIFDSYISQINGLPSNVKEMPFQTAKPEKYPFI